VHLRGQAVEGLLIMSMMPF